MVNHPKVFLRAEDGIWGTRAAWLWATSLDYSCEAKIGVCSATKNQDQGPGGRLWSEIITDSSPGASDLEASRRTT